MKKKLDTFIQQLLSAFCEPIAVLGIRDKEENKSDKTPDLFGADILVKDITW